MRIYSPDQSSAATTKLNKKPRRVQGGEQDDEFALDEDDERGDRNRARRSGKAPGSKGKNKGETDRW